jgi:hypothetical protein
MKNSLSELKKELKELIAKGEVGGVLTSADVEHREWLTEQLWEQVEALSVVSSKIITYRHRQFTKNHREFFGTGPIDEKELDKYSNDDINI